MDWFNSTSSRMISRADCRSAKLKTLHKCGSKTGSNNEWSHSSQLSSSFRQEIARAESKSGLHRSTILLSSLNAKPAGDVRIRAWYHELASLPALSKRLDSAHRHFTGIRNSIVPAPGFRFCK